MILILSLPNILLKIFLLPFYQNLPLFVKSRYADVIVHRLLLSALKEQDWWSNKDEKCRKGENVTDVIWNPCWHNNKIKIKYSPPNRLSSQIWAKFSSVKIDLLILEEFKLCWYVEVNNTIFVKVKIFCCLWNFIWYSSLPWTFYVQINSSKNNSSPNIYLD